MRYARPGYGRRRRYESWNVGEGERRLLRGVVSTGGGGGNIGCIVLLRQLVTTPGKGWEAYGGELTVLDEHRAFHLILGPEGC